MKFTPRWLLLFDGLVVVTAFLLSFAVRVPLRDLGEVLPRYTDYLPALLVIRLLVIAMYGLYRSIWARAAIRELVAVFL